MKEFIFWDGEATQDAGYCLFGCSKGHRVKHPELSTKECLDLILAVEQEFPTAIHVGFAFGYDVNNIIKDLPFQALLMLYEMGGCRWGKYKIEYIPRKWFSVTCNGVRAKIYDVYLFFNCKFGRALSKYNLGSEDEIERIESGKEERPRFLWSNIDEIEQYWETEISLGRDLVDKLRGILYSAGFAITSWHGPGALANYGLRKHNVDSYNNPRPDDTIVEISRYGMFGGRFQAFFAGFYLGPVYVPDINSAYAYAISRLPSLATGKWLHIFEPDPSECRTRRLGYYKIRYLRKFANTAMPLPHRSRNGDISYPPATMGWYHASEAALVSKDPNAEFLEAWVYEDDGTYPFEWILEEFDKRLELQRNGDPTEKGLKWALAAYYGQFALRAGWKRTGKAPGFHQLEWAGAITAECRSMLYSGSRSVANSLISFDTDGFISLKRPMTLPNGEGEQLGQWKLKEYAGILFLQNGIYWLLNTDGTWEEPKSRGIPRKKFDIEAVLPKIQANETLEFSQHMFIGFNLALNQDLSKWRTWQDIPRKIEFGGGGKAFHDDSRCSTCRSGKSYGEALHPLIQRIPNAVESAPYKLPWLDDTPPTIERVLKEWGIYNE